MARIFTSPGRLASAVTALCLSLGTIVAIAAPASANDGDCGSGDICLYEHINLEGGRWDNFGAVMNYASGHRWWGTTISINDQASSAKNRHSFGQGVCEHSWGRGYCLYIGGGMDINNFVDYEMNDKGSSNIW